ncbi:MAG: helix-turn-helix domain-containing protein [Treponema sp.]|jgi:transcriptional regulator with XRE-family HTH domain|nr:helix-turn-helix domain-containing protein [Treponema sp.]
MEEQELKHVLGRNIKFFRFRSQFSQADLAEKVDISVIERGNNFPQAGTLCNLAKAFEIEVWELFRGEGASDDEKTVISRISEDFTKHVNIALAEVAKQYMA